MNSKRRKMNDITNRELNQQGSAGGNSEFIYLKHPSSAQNSKSKPLPPSSQGKFPLKG